MIAGHRRTRDERGVVGGAEALAFGCLLFVAGTLMVTNAWAVVETRVALDLAAREYLRSYTNADDPAGAADAGEWAARVALEARGTPLRSLRVIEPDPTTFGPCGSASVALQAQVPALRVPFLGTLGSSEVRVTHSELIGAHREVTAHERFDATTTACSSG